MSGSAPVRQVIAVGLVLLAAFIAWHVLYRPSQPATRMPAGPVRVYALWQPKESGPYAKAAGAIGGEMVLRVLVKSDALDGDRADVESAMIIEEASKVHKSIKRKIAASFEKSKPDPRWGDPEHGVVVLQSAPIPTAGYHNFAHTVDVRLRSGSRTLDGSTRLRFGNLVLVDTTTPRDVVSIKSSARKSILVSCRLEHAQRGACDLKYEVFAAEDHSKPIVTRVFRGAQRPGRHSWRWNGLLPNRSRAKSGTFVYRISAEASRSDTDSNVSPYLRVLRVLDPTGHPIVWADYLGGQDLGVLNRVVPTSQTYLQWWELADARGTSASSGEIWAYSLDMERIMSTDVADMGCREHRTKGCGLAASRTGTRHSLVTTVRTDMVDAGVYCWILHVVDDHANLYRDHKPKPALPLN